MAEAILRDKASHVNVKSAGVFASENSPASPQAVIAMESRGIELDHNSQMITEPLLEWADLVLTMTENHKQTLISYFPQLSDKYFTLIEYTNTKSAKSKDIADPFGGNVGLYEETAKQLEKYIDKIIQKTEK